jgi:processive 1,2-diacylglycerol beta-glucosyltransferase
VPGQEEGNLRLLETIGGGGLAATPEAMGSRIRDLLAGGAAGWREMKHALAVHGHHAGAIAASHFVLSHLKSPPLPST